MQSEGLGVADLMKGKKMEAEGEESDEE